MSERDWESIAKERLDAIVEMGTRAKIAEIRTRDAEARAEAAEAKLLDAEMKRDHANEAAFEYKAACEAAEARVKVLEEALRKIADEEYDSWPAVDVAIAALNALAAKEKP